MSLPRYYVENLVSIEPDKKSGMIKMTFGVNKSEDGKNKSEDDKEEIVQLIVHTAHFRGIFGKIGETMQRTFADGPGRRGGPGDPKKPDVEDITT